MNIDQLKQNARLFFICTFLMFITSVQADEGNLKTIDLKKDWGIEPVMLRISAGGYMIEFRYKVLDVDKATVLSVNKEFPHLLSMKSKAKFDVPYGSTVGYLKSNRKFLKLNRNYITMFANENRHMLPGDQVKIMVGNEVSPPLTIDK